MFSEPLAKIKNETKIKTSLRARGPPKQRAYSAYREDRLWVLWLILHNNYYKIGLIFKKVSI